MSARSITVKFLATLSALLFYTNLSVAQVAEVPVVSTIERATVFLQGAQLFRTASAQVPAGRSNVVFSQLDIDLNPESIQLSTDTGVTVLSVSARNNFLAEATSTEEVQRLNQLKKLKTDSLQQEELALKVFLLEENMLMQNQSVGSPEAGVDLAKLRAMADFFRTRLSDIKQNQLKHKNVVSRLQNDVRDIDNQLSNLAAKNRRNGSSEVVALVEAASAGQYDFSFNYVTPNASWSPLYDIRVEDVDSPMMLHYKANIEQYTREDWDDIMLTLSTANPSVNTDKPELDVWRIGYAGERRMLSSVVRSMPARKKASSRVIYGSNMENPAMIAGRVVADTGEPLAGASVMCANTLYGVQADLEGFFEIQNTANCSELVVNYIGFESFSGEIRSDRMDFVLSSSGMELDEVTVDYFSPPEEGGALETTLVSNTTSAEFHIPVPYSVASNEDPTLVEVAVHPIDAHYEYYIAPAVKQEAFLTAAFSDWEAYGLLNGDANLIFNNVYVGQAYINTSNVDDSLKVSLGKDQGISVERKQSKAFTSKRQLGSKKTDSFGFDIQVRNNKTVPVTVIIEERIPVSSDNSIEVDLRESNKADYNEETGRLVWKITMEPLASETIAFSYDVKYPKGRRVSY